MLLTFGAQEALAYARFNAAVNDIRNVEFRLGSLFEPVEGERFDHIVSNPPFVITPRTDGVPDYEYRDGGMVGDALLSSLSKSSGAPEAPNWSTRAEEKLAPLLPSFPAAGSTD